MSIEIERAIDRQTQALVALTDAIQEMTVTNQKVLMVLLEFVAGDEEELKVQTDMEGNPV